MNTFGDFLYSLRKEKAITQAELAKRLGVTNKAVSKWETGEAMPETSLLLPISRIFGVTVDELLDGKRAETQAEEQVFQGNEGETFTVDEIKKHVFTRGKDETFLEKICGAICAAIMCAGLIVYFTLGAFFNMWSPYWVIIPVCALSCGVTGVVFDMVNPQKRAEKIARGENPFIGGICGLIVLISFIAYFLAGVFTGLWHPLWVIFVGGTFLCVAVAAIGNIFIKNKNNK